MIIDLNTDGLNWAETNNEVSKLKSSVLIKEVIRQRNQTGHNFMIVPMSIYNHLVANDKFIYASLDEGKDTDSLRHMGRIMDIEVYLDLLSPSDTIILKFDKHIMRDNKLEAILNEGELKGEIEITVLNY